MRDLLGDERFPPYLRAAETRFARSCGVLLQIDEMTKAKALDRWWVRKRDELADLQWVAGLDRKQLKIQAEVSAMDILGPDALLIYLADEDARWPWRCKPDRIYGNGQVAQQGKQVD